MALESKSADSEIINRIIRSSVFEGSETLIKLLRYLAEKSHDESGDAVKEYQIATEALGRNRDFDPRFDSYVRTHVTRLRSKLLEYSVTEGKNDPYKVKIPKGAYRLMIVPTSEAPVQNAGSDAIDEAGLAESEKVDENALEVHEEVSVGQVHRWKRWTVALACLASSTLGLALWAFFARPNPQQAVDPVVAKFWRSFSSDGQGPLLVYSNARFAREPNSNIHSYDARFDPPNSVLDHFTGVGEVLAVHELDRVFIPQGIAMHLTRGALLSLDDAKSRNLILVGRPAEGPSVNDLVALRYFEFQDISEGPHAGEVAVRNLHPEGKENEFYLKSPELPITDDYAIVARVPGLNNDHKILLAAGTTTIGTEAAVEYLCHPETLRVLMDKLGSQTPDENFEAVLYLKIARGVPVKTELVAIRKYSSGEN